MDQREGHQLCCWQSSQSWHGQQADGKQKHKSGATCRPIPAASVSLVCEHPSPPQELFPANKRSCEHFSKYFTDAGLKELSDFARNQQSIGARKELQKELQEQMSRGDPLKEVRPQADLFKCLIYHKRYTLSSEQQVFNTSVFAPLSFSEWKSTETDVCFISDWRVWLTSLPSLLQIIAFTREEMKKANLSEQAMISIIWTSVMSSVEWNKKEELVTEQAIKHLKVRSRAEEHSCD